MSLKPGRVQSGVPLGVDGVGRGAGVVRTHAMSLPGQTPIVSGTNLARKLRIVSGRNSQAF